jgi:hypothetical protein
VQCEVDFTLPVGVTGPLQQYFADHLPGLGSSIVRTNHLPGRSTLLAELELQHGVCLRAVAPRPRHEAHDLGSEVEREQAVEIVQSMQSQLKALRRQRIRRTCQPEFLQVSMPAHPRLAIGG